MQDVIERKIEKFSSQNVNVQKRVNTSSKFRNNANNVMISPISGQHGPPGSSGGQGTSADGMGSITKKKYNINQPGNENEFYVNDNSYFANHNQMAPLPIKAQAKRPNTIANQHAYTVEGSP